MASSFAAATPYFHPVRRKAFFRVGDGDYGYILITFLVIILVLYLVARLPVDARAKQIIQVIVIIIGVISLLKYLAVF